MIGRKVYAIRFKPPNMKQQSFEADWASIHGDHLVLADADGRMVALFLFDIIESWNETPLQPF